MQTVAQAWLVYRMTKSALLLGSVGFASQIPVFLVAPFGGITADRVNRQRLVIATQTASMILAGILAWLTLERTRPCVAHLRAGGPARSGQRLRHSRPPVLPRRHGRQRGPDERHRAEFLDVQWRARHRPAIAGILVAKIGEGWCFAANSISYIAVIVGLSLMHVHCAPRASEHSPIEDIIEGFRWVNHTRDHPRAALAARPDEPGRHALHRADARSSPTKSSTAARAASAS